MLPLKLKNRKSLVMAIDPSINDCGCAVVINGEVKHKELIHPITKDNEYVKSLSIFNRIAEVADKYGVEKGAFILEIPEYWRVAGAEARESGSIPKLTFLCGCIFTLANTIQDFTVIVPSKWKGQLPKGAMQARLKKFYPPWFVGLDHNVVDAIGLTHWYLYGRV